MSTIGNLVNRVYRTYLHPPDHQIPMVRSLANITDNQTSFRLDATEGFQVPEDEELLRRGVIIEWDRELMRVVDYDNIDRIDVVRGVEGTTAAAHNTADFIKLSPPFARQSVFESVRDNIISLYPDLYTVETKMVVAVDGYAAAIDDDLAVDVERCWPNDWVTNQYHKGQIIDYHPNIGGRAVISSIPGAFWVQYRRRFGVATDEADTYQALGFESVWEPIVMAGAAADQLIGRDVPESFVEWIGQVLQSQNIPVGTRSQIGATLRNYRSVLIRESRREMSSEYTRGIRYRSPFEQVG